MKFILGKKMSMTQVWKGDKVVAVTPVQAGPCVVTRIKDQSTDGYNAVQLGFGSRKAKNVSKSVKGQMKGFDTLPRYIKEFRVEAPINGLESRQFVSCETFALGDVVDVIGTSKGRGFQGVVKRHHFSGHKKTHGNKDQERHSGSVAPKGPAHVFKGTRMGGHMGSDRVTIKNLEVVFIDPVENLLYIKGAIPGSIDGLVMIQGKGDLKFSSSSQPATVEATPEEVIEPVQDEAVESTPVAETSTSETPAVEAVVKEEPQA